MKIQNIVKNAAVGLLLVPVLALAESPDILITKVPGADGGKIYFEFVNNGQVAGLQFEFRIPGAAESNINSDQCIAGVANSAMGACNLVGETFKVAILGKNLETVPTGQIGSIDVQGVDLSRAEVVITNVVMSTSDAEEIEGGSLVDQRAASDWGRLQRVK